MRAVPPRFVPVSSTAAESVGPHLDAERMRRLLVSAELLREVPQVDDPDAPQAWLSAIRGLVFSLADAESRYRAARHSPRWLRFSPPPYWWLGLPLMIAGGGGLALVLGDTFEERALVLAWEARVLLLVVVAVVGWTIARNLLERRRVAADRVAAEAERDASRAALLDGVTGLLGRSFLARIGPHAWLRSTPHRAWVEARLRDVRGVAHAAPPDLVADLEAARDTLVAAEEAACAAPPEAWGPLDAGVDLPALAVRWDAAGLARARDEVGRWAVLGCAET